jgi:hypothetical protein
VIPDPAPPFEVDASGRVRDRIRRMLDRAAQLGVQTHVAGSLQAVLGRLTTDPRDFGDRLWHFHSLQMTQYGGTTDGLRCKFSVHDRIPTVVITNLFPLPGHALYGQNLDG